MHNRANHEKHTNYEHRENHKRRDNCELMQEEHILRLSMEALAIMLLCLLSILGE